jgi:hypothetical protein
LALHELSEAAGMGRIDADELVEIEGGRKREADASCRVQTPQLFVGSDRRAAGRQAQDDRRLLLDRICDARGQRARDLVLGVEDVNVQC